MSRSDLFRNLLLMAAVDGRMSESELRLLVHRAAQWGITGMMNSNKRFRTRWPARRS